MGLLFLFYPILEIIAIVQIGGRIGFVNTLFWFLAAGVLGFGVVKARGRFLLGSFQSTLARGEIPAKDVLHSMLVLIGGFALMIPGFLSDAVGLLFILPGTRHLIASYTRATLEKKMRSGSFRVFTAGGGPFGAGPFGKGPFGSQPPPPGAGDGWRDVSPREIEGEVIEAEVVSSSSRSKDDDSN